MGANAQTSVPLFVANSVLTAAQQNISAATGVPVFATTVTRDAAFGGSNKALAEGQLCYLESTNVVQYYDGAAWATVGPAPAPTSGLNLISATTIGSAVSSVTVTGAFSATYDAYKIVVTGGVASGNIQMQFLLGASITTYYNSLIYAPYASGTPAGIGNNNQASWDYVGYGTTDSLAFNADILDPFATKYTKLVNATYEAANEAGVANGVHKTATSYTSFIIRPSSGTFTGGTIRVYGYANS
jgi:hypothetical protein